MHTCHYCGHEFDEQLERCPQCTGWVRPQSPKPPVTYYPSDAASFVRLTTAANPTEAQRQVRLELTLFERDEEDVYLRSDEVQVQWEDINLQDMVEEARAGLYQAQTNALLEGKE